MRGPNNDSFDYAAETYDEEFTFSKIGTAQREKVWGYFEYILKGDESLNVLELNCGTGEDAIMIAKGGHKIIATDSSSKMLEVSRSKSQKTSHEIQFELMDLRTISASSFNQKFDVIFSNFGGLNCLSSSEMKKLGYELTQLLKPSGKLVMVIMPKSCIWEICLFIMKLKFKHAFRRRSTQLVNVAGIQVRTWYYNPKELFGLIGSTLKLGMIKPIGLFIPPSYLESFAIRNKRLFTILRWLERNIASFSWQASFSDHYYIEFEKS